MPHDHFALSRVKGFGSFGLFWPSSVLASLLRWVYRRRRAGGQLGRGVPQGPNALFGRFDDMSGVKCRTALKDGDFSDTSDGQSTRNGDPFQWAIRERRRSPRRTGKRRRRAHSTIDVPVR